jgi:hypothetical protein
MEYALSSANAPVGARWKSVADAKARVSASRKSNFVDCQNREVASSALRCPVVKMEVTSAQLRTSSFLQLVPEFLSSSLARVVEISTFFWCLSTSTIYRKGLMM